MPDTKPQPEAKPAPKAAPKPVAKHKAARVRVQLADLASHIHLPEGVSLAAIPQGHLDLLVIGDKFAEVEKGSEPLADRSHHALLSQFHHCRSATGAVGTEQPDGTWMVKIVGGGLSGKEYPGFANLDNAKVWCRWHGLVLKNEVGINL